MKKQPDSLVSVHVNLSEILYSLSQNFDIGDDELFNFIRDLDDSRADWDFTMRLCKHFAALQKKYDEELT